MAAKLVVKSNDGIKIVVHDREEGILLIKMFKECDNEYGNTGTFYYLEWEGGNDDESKECRKKGR